MVGRKLSTVALAGSIVVVALIGGCRDESPTGPSTTSAKDAAGIRLQTGDAQTGPVALPLSQLLTVKVVDAGGLPVAGASVKWTVLAGSGGTNPPTGISDANGLVSTTWTLGTALGANTLRAYLTGAYMLDSTTFTATATFGAPASIALVASSQPAANTAVATAIATPLSYTVLDAYGHPVTGAAVAFSANAGSSVLPTTALTDANGTVSTVWTTGNLVGTETATATLVGQLPVVVSTVTTPDTSRRMVKVSGDAQTATLSDTLPAQLKVKVTDRFGNIIANAPVAFADSLGVGATIVPALITTDSTGAASATWHLAPIFGPQQVRVSSPGSGVQLLRFTATASVGTNISIAVNAGTPAAAIPVATRVNPVTYIVLDAQSRPVSGIPVAFTQSSATGSVTPTTQTTGADGKVTANWTLGILVGNQTLNATLPGQAPLAITAIATADTSRLVTIVSGNNQPLPVTSSGALSFTLPLPLTVQVLDRFGNVVANEPINFADSTANADVVIPTGVNPGLTDATGTATATWKLSSLVGLHGIRVRDGSRSLFVRFSATGQVTFRDVFAGNFFTCGIGANSQAYCWGFGQDGQLGNVALISRNAPSWPVTSTDTIASPAFTTFRSLSGGKSHVCGVGTSSQSIWCWGTNPDGRQFMLPPTAPTPKSTNVDAPAFAGNSQLGSSRSVSAGEAFSCAVTLGGIAFCAGNDELGQVGIGSAVALSGTTRVDTTTQGGITPPTLYSAVATGARHACGFPRAAVGVVQTPWCWGQNISGQVGNGSTVDTLRPSQVPLPIGVTAFDSTSVVAGAAHTCALVLTGTVPAGTAFCWGNNALGQLGLGAASGVPVTAPTQVDASTPVFAKLYAGLNHTCGLTSAGAAYCWGYNASGQLGDGTQTNQAIAVPVLGGPFANLAMGEQHTCGITVAAPVAVFCWGDNSFGQLGTNDFVAVLTPTKVKFQQ